MKLRTKAIATGVLAIALVIGLVATPLSGIVEAGTIQNSYMFLDSMDANQASGLEFILAANPAQSFTGANIELKIEFPDSEDAQWCKTAGALGITATATSAANQGGQAIDNALPVEAAQTLAATCAQGSGAGSYDTITITEVGDLTNGTTYGVQIDDSGLGVLGTATAAGNHLVTISINQGATIDSTTYALELVSDGDVVVSATVAAAPTVTCSLSSNTVALGTLYQGGAYATGTHTVTASTSTTAKGYYWVAFGEGDGSTDAGLYKSTATTDLLASTGSTTIDLRTTEGFGIVVTDPESGSSTTEAVPADFSAATPGVFGSLDRLYAGAQMVLYQQGAAETSGDTATVTYGGKAGAAAVVGSYSETVTFVCGGYY